MRTPVVDSGNVNEITFSVCGSLPSLGATVGALCPGPMDGNYVYTEVFHGNGTVDPPTEFPRF